jgi:predicted RNase H-like HicB family nuclease
MNYKVILEPSEEGFAVSVPGLPGCHSQLDIAPSWIAAFSD